MRKTYKELTQDQKDRGVMFSSTLSICTNEQPGDTTHEVFKSEGWESSGHIQKLLDDSFFNRSPWKYNIIRRC